MNVQLPLDRAPQRVPLTVEDVLLLDRQGAFAAYKKVELLGGDLLYVNAQYRRHMVVKSELAYRIRRVLERIGTDLFVGTEGSVMLSQTDLPQPDILLTSAPGGDGAVPGDSIALLVEVADTTLAFDLGRKAQVYAAAGVPEYWVVDVQSGTVHQLWSAVGPRYAERRIVPTDGTITAATIPDLTVDLANL